MRDDILEFLYKARTSCLEEQKLGKDSNELTTVIANIGTAILWRNEDLSIKTPILNQCSQLSPSNNNLAISILKQAQGLTHEHNT